MSVLVNGMKMPKGCYECPLTDGEYGDCKVGATGEYDTYRKGCPLDEPKTGRWVRSHTGTIGEGFYCSRCGKFGYKTDFCPNCGADMRCEEE